jgi:hypothetical protein
MLLTLTVGNITETSAEEHHSENKTKSLLYISQFLNGINSIFNVQGCE